MRTHFRAQQRQRKVLRLVCATSILGITQLSLWLQPISAGAQTPKAGESEVKAAYLLNFGRFVHPAGQRTPHESFDICILGRDPLGASLDAIAASEVIDNHPIHVRRLGDITDGKACAILFLSSFESERIREDLAILGSADILTVSDSADFLEQGGMIQFVFQENRVRFAVNLDAVNRAHLVISSELLRVAASVTGKPPAGGQP